MANLRFTGWTSPIKVFGVQVRVHLSWLIVALLIAWSLATGSLPMIYAGLPTEAYWAMAALIILGLGLSIVLHEIAHTLAGRALGISIDRITLFLLGGVAELHEEPKRPAAELVMSLAGPLFSVLFSILLAFAAGSAAFAGAPDAVVGGLGYLATLNIVLAGFNLLPAFPLDGGRVVRAVIWMVTGDGQRATRLAATVGEAFAMLMMVAGLVTALVGEVASGLWWILIGLFLQVAAHGARADAEARTRFAGHPIEEVMARGVESVAPDMTLDVFVEQHLLATHHGLYPVVEGGVWKGVVEPADVLRAPRDRWATMTLREIFTPSDLVPVASPRDDAAEVLERMQRQEKVRLLVVDAGAVVGIVTLKDIQARMALERSFRPHAA